jgi:hypothetical protein
MSMLKLNVGPTHVELDEVIAGSVLLFSILLEQEDPLVPCTYLPFDFSGYTVIGYVKRNVNLAAVDAYLNITVPGLNGAGWIDVRLDGDVTTSLAEAGKCTFNFSIKIFPIGDPTNGTTIVVGTFPIVRAATP